MRLFEEIDKIKSMMGINKKRPILNIDMIEQNGSDFESTDKNFEKEIDDNKDFSNSQIQKIVWRAGEIKLNPKAGGIWFAETKKGVEDFAWSVRNEKRVGKPYYINLVNPYYMDSFWYDYTEMAGYGPDGRKSLMEKLINEGYDGIIIGEDTWNDTADEYSVTSEQYVVFDEKNIKPAN